MKNEDYFDLELEKLNEGKLPDSHVFNLGKPGEILQNCGFPAEHRIELAASRLRMKANQGNHPFDILDIKGLTKALQEPVAVFEYGDKNKSQNVIVNLEKDGKNFLVGVFFNQIRDGFEVSSIRGLFNRDNMDWIHWIQQGKMIYGNKEKIQVLAEQQRTNLADVYSKEARTSSDSYYLDSADNILQSFGDVKDIYTKDFPKYAEQKERFEIFKKFRNAYKKTETINVLDVVKEADEFYDALKSNNKEVIARYTDAVENPELAETTKSIIEEHSFSQKEKSQENQYAEHLMDQGLDSLDSDKILYQSNSIVNKNEIQESEKFYKGINENIFESISDYLEKGSRPANDRFVIGRTPLVLQITESNFTEVTIPTSVIKKAVEIHNLSKKEIFDSIYKLYNPILIFDSDKNATENKNESKLILTDVFKDEKPIALAVNINTDIKLKDSNISVEVQDIRSIHDRTVISKNGTDLIKKWSENGLCRYVDDKKIANWSSLARVQFPIEPHQLAENNILTKTELVNKTTSALVIDSNQAARIKAAWEIKENMPNLSEKERAAAVAILEAGAKSQGMEFSEYVEKTFPDGIFGDIKKAENAAKQQGIKINGAVSVNGFGENVKAVIYAGKTADFSTWCHELSHIWQAQLTGELKQNAEEAFQVKGSDWQNSIYTFQDGHTDTSAEAFAYGFEDFLKNKAGEMATEDKKEIFEKFADYMSRTYNGVKQHIEINEKIASVYQKFVELDDNILAQAEKAVQMENSFGKELFEKIKNKQELSFSESQKLYPNIVDLSEEFSNQAPSEKEVLEKLRSMVGEIYATSTDGKTLRIPQGRDKLSHIFKGDTYKRDFRKKRELNRKLAYNAEKIIENAVFTEAELPKPEKNKDYLLGMHNYEVPVFVNGHGFLVRLEGEVIKKLPTSAPGSIPVQKNTSIESNIDNNELLLKLQATEVSNLYVIRKQKELFQTAYHGSGANFDKTNSVFFELNSGDTTDVSDSILEGKPIKEISTKEFNYDGSNLKDFALNYIKNNPIGNAKTKIGNVEISETGLRHSLSHTIYKNKLYAIPAIKDTLEKGTYLGVIKDFEGKRQNNYYFAAPITIDNDKNILFIRAKHVAGRDKTLYIHDIFTLDEIKKVTPYSGEPNATRRSLRGATLAKSIIQDYEKNNIIQSNPILFQTAYHGSGANFDKFNTSEYGMSGEGSMAFGYGVYVSNSESIAKSYAGRQGERNLYTVEIPDGNYINWEKTVSKTQKENVKNELYKKLIEEDYKGAEKEIFAELNTVFGDELDGKYLYGNVSSYIGSDKETSKFFKDIGFSGIEYPAGTIFGNGQNAVNYVIFNDEDIKIKEHFQFQKQKEEIIMESTENLESQEYWKNQFQQDNAETFKAIEEYLDNGIRPKNDEFIFEKVPEILKSANVSENEIVIKTSVINKAKNAHSLSGEEIKDSIKNIASPVLIYDSDMTTTENKKQSFLCLTDTFAENGKPIAFAMNLDSDYERKNRLLEINEIRSIHDRTLVAKNGTDLIQKWTENGLCRYVDDKKISEWSKAAGVQFPLAVLQSDESSILSESNIVNDKKISERQLAAGVQSPLAVLHPDKNNIILDSEIVNGTDYLEIQTFSKFAEQQKNMEKEYHEYLGTISPDEESSRRIDSGEIFGKRENQQAKEELNVSAYKFQNGETLDEIIQGNSVFPTEAALLNNMIDGNIREVYEYATDEEKTVLRQFAAFRNDYDTDMKNLTVQTDCVSRWIAAKHWNPEIQEFQQDYVNHAAVAEFPYKLPWEMKAIESQVLQSEKENVPELKIYSELKEEKIKNLETVTQEEFERIVDALYQEGKPDYKNIPEIIRLPKLNNELAAKLNIDNENFFLKTNIAHSRPQRKGGYDQSLRKEEMKGMLGFISSCQTAYIDTDERHQNFFLAGLDEKDSTKANKIVFNKDELGNYIVTIGKVENADFNSKNYAKVAVGVEPTIWRAQNEHPIATMLRSSTTLATDETIPQVAEKSMNEQKTKLQILEQEDKEQLAAMAMATRNVIKESLAQNAEPLVEIDFSKANYDRLFPRAIVQTPLETVKLGENQFEKLDAKDRKRFLLATFQTLATPDVVIDEERDGNHSHNYIKSFVFDEKTKTVQDVVVNINGENISITAHPRDINNVVNKIKMPDQLVYAAARVGQMIEQRTLEAQSIVNPTRVDRLSTISVPLNTEYSIENALSIISEFQTFKGQKTEPDFIKKFEKLKNLSKTRAETEENAIPEKENLEGKNNTRLVRKSKSDIIKEAGKDFLKSIQNGIAPFFSEQDDFEKIIMRPQAIINASNGLPFSGESQLLAQIYHTQKEMKGEIVTSMAGAKEAGTIVLNTPENRSGKNNFVLTDTTPLAQKNAVIRTRYFMLESCEEPEKIYAHTLQQQRPEKIRSYRDLIRHFENIPNGQKEIADIRIRIAHEHLKEIQSRFSVNEERTLSVDEIEERKNFLRNYFERLPSDYRDSERGVFEDTFGIQLNPEKTLEINLERKFKDIDFDELKKSTKKSVELENRKLSDFIEKNTMENKRLATLFSDEYKTLAKEEKLTARNLKIEAVGIKEPETFLGKYLAACNTNAEFITDKETVNEVKKNLVKKLEENFKIEKYDILKEIGQQAQSISNETTKQISFEKAHSNKKNLDKNISPEKQISLIGMGK